jgi:hypothetical protein
MKDKELVNIEFDFYYEDGLDIDDQITEAIIENVGEFREYFARLVSADGDLRTTIDIGNTEIEDFNYDNDSLSGIVFFEFFTDFYAGCKDMNSYDEHSSPGLTFSVDMDSCQVIFDEFELPPEWLPDQSMEDY